MNILSQQEYNFLYQRRNEDSMTDEFIAIFSIDIRDKGILVSESSTLECIFKQNLLTISHTTDFLPLPGRRPLKFLQKYFAVRSYSCARKRFDQAGNKGNCVESTTSGFGWNKNQMKT